MNETPLLGVLIDGTSLAAWQAEALRQLGKDYRLRFYDCTNMKTPPRKLQHFPYYALNLLTLRTARTRSVPLPKGAEVIHFACDHEGIWQRLPSSLIERFSADQVVAIVKFGMGLLRVPDTLTTPILSYHHGDPRCFRGRPAGFYELLAGAAVVGQIVQRLSNRLDAGSVLSYGEVKALPHSYRATMDSAYRLSPLLLGPALRNALEDRSLALRPEGRVTRLPGPATVLRFIAARMAASARRLVYGALFEKRWKVSTAPLQATSISSMEELPGQEHWSTLGIPDGYSFLADPFFLPDGSIVAEALSSRSGLGDILRFGNGTHDRILSGGHYSYPLPVGLNGTLYMLPEMSDQDAPRLFTLEADEAVPGPVLRLPKEERLLDATSFTHHGRTYLFANRVDEGAGVLRLWSGESLDSEMLEHPQSPICLTPAGARMGGPIILEGETIFRLGQDGRGAYGDGLLLFEIEDLSPVRYRERAVRLLRCANGEKGPHTLDYQSGSLLFDHYRERFAPLAGLRRLKARLARR